MTAVSCFGKNSEMKTEIIEINDIEKQADVIEKAAKMLKDGELVAFPTETVYGLAANGLNQQAVKALYEAKERPSYKAFSLQVADVAMAEEIAEEITPMAKALMDAFCPGPITIILKKKKEIPSIVTGGKNTVGIRIPDNPVALAVLKQARIPLAVPSANVSSHPSPKSATDVFYDMQGRIPLILDGGACSIGTESTIVDCTDEIPVIIRHGAISEKEINEILKII